MTDIEYTREQIRLLSKEIINLLNKDENDLSVCLDQLIQFKRLEDFLMS